MFQSSLWLQVLSLIYNISFRLDVKRWDTITYQEVLSCIPMTFHHHQYHWVQKYDSLLHMMARSVMVQLGNTLSCCSVPHVWSDMPLSSIHSVAFDHAEPVPNLNNLHTLIWHLIQTYCIKMNQTILLFFAYYPYFRWEAESIIQLIRQQYKSEVFMILLCFKRTIILFCSHDAATSTLSIRLKTKV